MKQNIGKSNCISFTVTPKCRSRVRSHHWEFNLSLQTME